MPIPFIRGNGLCELVIQVRNIHVDAVVFDSVLLDSRAERIEAMRQIDVIAFNDRQVGHGLAWHGFAFPLGPIPHLGLRNLIRRIMQQRSRDQIPKRLGKVGARKFAGLFRERPENVPVAPRFPARRNRRAQRMNSKNGDRWC